MDTELVQTEESAAQNNEASMFTPLVVVIYYSLKEPANGLYFVMPDAYSAPKRLPHLYSNNSGAGARSWFPCVDKMHVKCSWELEITLPRTVEAALGFSEKICNQEMMAIASGDLIDHLIHPKNSLKKIFVYSVKTPVCASSIMLAIGPFESLEIPGWGSAASHHDASVPDTDEVERPAEGRLFGGGRTFYLAGRRTQVETTTAFLYQVSFTCYVTLYALCLGNLLTP